MRVHNSKMKMIISRFVIIIFVLLAMYVTVFMSGCTTVSKFVAVNPVSILPTDADLYLKLPVTYNQQLIESVVTKFIPDLGEKNTKKLVASASVVYVSIDIQQKKANLVAEGNFPSLISLILTEKNGWTKTNKKGSIVPYPYYTHTNGMELAFPTNSLALISSFSVSELLMNYENELLSVNRIVPKLFNSSNNKDVSFVVNNPSALLPLVFGNNIQIGVTSAVGTFVPIENSQLNYNLNVDITVADSRAVKPFILLLNTFTSKASPRPSFTQEGVDVIKCSNIELSVNKIISIFIGG